MSGGIHREKAGWRLVAGRAATRHFIAAFAGVNGIACIALVFAGLVASAAPAAADFRLCNNTASRVGVAVGYKDADGWTTEGWWNLPARTCETVLKGNLVARFYYVYAIDYDHGGEWMGQAFMCTRDKEFTIRGISDCLARGFDRTGFFEVDTGEQRAWTVQLTESTEQSSRSLPTGNPLPPSSPPAGAPGSAGATAAPPAAATRPAPGAPTLITPPGTQNR
jgi:uncharacterized membrane protein